MDAYDALYCLLVKKQILNVSQGISLAVMLAEYEGSEKAITVNIPANILVPKASGCCFRIFILFLVSLYVVKM